MKVKVAKNYSFREKIWQMVDTCCLTGKVPDISLPCTTPRLERETKGKVNLKQKIKYSFEILYTNTEAYE